MWDVVKAIMPRMLKRIRRTIFISYCYVFHKHYSYAISQGVSADFS